VGRSCHVWPVALALCLAASPIVPASVVQEDAAVEAAERAGDREALRLALRTRGLNAIPAGRLQRGVRSLRRALELLPEEERGEERAVSLMMLGWALQNVGRYEEALEHYERAGALYREEGMRRPDRAAVPAENRH